MVVITAMWLAACSRDPAPLVPAPAAQPQPDEAAVQALGGDGMRLGFTAGRASVTVDVDAWLGWTGEPRAGVRRVSDPPALELLARAGARRSTDGAAKIVVDEGVPGSAVLELADRLRRAGYRAVGFRPGGVEGAWHPVTEGAPGDTAKAFSEAWSAAEAQGPDAVLRLVQGPGSGPAVASPEASVRGVVRAWTESMGLGMVVDTESTRLDLDPLLTRLHPALAVGPIEVASGPRRDAELVDAVDLLWGASELTGRRPGPVHLDVTIKGDVPPGSAASVSRRLRERP